MSDDKNRLQLNFGDFGNIDEKQKGRTAIIFPQSCLKYLAKEQKG